VGKILGIAATMKDGALWSMIIGAIISPTWDQLSMYIVALPLIVVSEAALGIALLVERRRSKGSQ
jgi:Sec-independent protein secretion pathway component TatC